MSDVRHHRRLHALAGALAWVLVSGLLVGLSAGPASAKVPRAAFRYTAAIEPLAGYVGQSTCSPAAKPGTTAFANLLLRTYPRSRSLGISRSCSVGGTSEHKEGRAFDWGLSVHKAGDRAAANAALKWLLQTDKFGNRHAMARRLGVQYIIWNRRIWGAYAAGSGWRRYTGSNPHTDHVHFSLSWAGARKKTSFWNPRNFPNSSGAAPSRPTRPTRPPRPTQPTQPTPDRPTRPEPGDRHDWPDPRPDERRHKVPTIPEPRAPKRLAKAPRVVVEQLTVPARRRAGVSTRKALVRGRRYLLEVSGTYRYATSSGSLADAECSTRGGASWWQRERSLRAEQWYADHLDLYVDGHDLQAQADDGDSCDRGHAYRWIYQPERTGRVPLVVWDPSGYGDNRGALTVRILDLGTTRRTMSWRVPATSAAGATSPGLLPGGEDYLVTISGTWHNGEGLVLDAECASGGGAWRRDVDSYDVTAGGWSYDSLSPRVGGVRTLPVTGGEGCDDGHRYTFVHHAERTSPLNVRVSDPGRFADNRGSLRVQVRPYDGPAPEPEDTPVTEILPERLEVDSRSSSAARTEQEYPAGTTLRVTATGMYFLRNDHDWVVADAECTVDRHDRYWRPRKYDGVFDGRRSPLGDLVVNGALVQWRPASGGDDCDARDHTYTYDLTVAEDGPLWFVVADDSYGDNRGALEVLVEER